MTQERQTLERIKLEAAINALYKIRNKRPLDCIEELRLVVLEERLDEIDGSMRR